MNREIKFRAWNTKNSCWCEGKGYTFYLNKFGNITFPESGWDINGPVTPPEEQGIAIMQYTGLKDKNGVEIYEGDIILTAFAKDKQAIWYSPTSGSYYLWASAGATIPLVQSQPLEVIGNIYENPELIK